MVPFRHQSREETVLISETARLAEEGSGSRRTERLRCTRSRVPVPCQHDNVSAREIEVQQNHVSRVHLNAGQSAPSRRKHRRALRIKHFIIHPESGIVTARCKRPIIRYSDLVPVPSGSQAIQEVRRAIAVRDRKSTRLNSSHGYISYAVFCLKKKKHTPDPRRRPHMLVYYI